jgi:hypothetical protein
MNDFHFTLYIYKRTLNIILLFLHKIQQHNEISIEGDRKVL